MSSEHSDEAEFKQEYYLLEGINKLLKEQTKDLIDLKAELENKLKTKEQSLLEIAQEKTLLNRINQKLEKKIATEKKQNLSEDYDDTNHVVDIFKIFKEISFDRLKQITGLDDDNLNTILSKLKHTNRITSVNKMTESACPECDSLMLDLLFCCPRCKNTEHHKTEIIEHYHCGNISPESDYVDDKCPSCNKPLSALGVDYKKLPPQYRCKNCEDLFSDLLVMFKCIQCKAIFSIKLCKWNESNGFKFILG